MLHLANRHFPALILALAPGSLMAGGVAAAGEPFLDLDLEQALERAKADKKPVFVAWSSQGNPECRRMELTYSDATVAAWITERTIPIVIDGDQKQRLAVKYVVSGYPQVTFLDAEGLVLDRIEGYFDSEGFMTRLEASNVASSGPVERPEGASEHDPKAWLAYGNYLYGARQQPEAVVEAYMFCLDSGEEYQPGFEAKYLDFLLQRLALMQQVAKTKPALRERRDRLEAALSNGTASLREAGLFLRYNFWLTDRNISIAMYDELAGSDEHRLALRAVLFDELLIELVALRRYSEVLESYGEVVPNLIVKIEACKSAEQAEPGDVQASPNKIDPSLKDSRNAIITDAVHLYESLLGTGKGETAAKLVDVLAEAFPSGRVYSLLMQHAMRLKMYDLARSLGERAKRELGAKAEKMIKRALRKLPPEEREAAEKTGKQR